MIVKKLKKNSSLKFLIHCYRIHGYARLKNTKKLKEKGYAKYKKGYEIRLVAKNANELYELRKHIIKAEINPAKYYKNGSQFIQPIYGYTLYKIFEEGIF